jgi:hypothetical protein
MSRFTHLRKVTKREEKQKKNKIFLLVYMMYFVKIYYQLRYPDITTALQTYYNINVDGHTFFLEAIAFPLL